jgi:GWxTD domain-containing protein
LFLFSIVFCFFTTGILSAQLKDKTIKNLEKEYFYIDPLIFYTPDSSNSRLDLYVEIPLSNLQLVKNSSTKKYEAYIDYTVEIKDSNGESITSDTRSESFSLTKEEQKNLEGKSEYIVTQYYLDPGNYKLNFILWDKNNLKEYKAVKNFEVNDIKNKDIALSDVMIISQYNENNGKKIITPLVNNNIGNLKDFYLFFEVYNNIENPIPAELSYKIVNSKNETIIEGTFSYVLQTGINKKIEKLPAKDFVVGDYKLEIKNNAINELVASKDFNFKWLYLPSNINDLDLAIDQMVYVAEPDQIDYIRDAKTTAEKEKRFIKFWKDNDPSPNTPKNELMNEYYNRIRIANERYSHYFDGWRTDMGMVYIIYGNPSNIDRNPFSMDQKPYEVWQYYELNKEFTFIDETGFGDYRLTTPIWDENATRIKY